jgi:hypothetical protein
MKESPQNKKLEEILRSSKFAAGGFLGGDKRSVPEIIDADLSELSKSGYNIEQVVDRMQEITNAAIAGLGTWVTIDKFRQAKVDEAKGQLPCPWPHQARFAKRITILRHADFDETIMWSDLNIHLIAEHGFFEGRDSDFRVEPGRLITMIF